MFQSVEINKTILKTALNSIYLKSNGWGLAPQEEKILLPEVIHEGDNQNIKMFVLEFREIPDKVLTVIYYPEDTLPGKYVSAEMLSLLGYSPPMENHVVGTAANKKGEKLKVLAAFFSKEKDEQQNTDPPLWVL